MPAGKYYKKKSNKPTKKKYRKKISAARQPFVEQKRRSSTGTITLNDTSTTLVPDSFEFTEQGDTAHTISGRWIYSKWINMNVLYDFTDVETDTIPQSYRVIQGWCKSNLNPTPILAGAGVLDPAALGSHVKGILDLAYQTPLDFGDKKRIQIIKDYTLMSTPLLLLEGASGHKVFRKNVTANYKWNIQRKIRYNHQTFGTPGVPYMQCNMGNWIPFIHFIRNPTGATASATYPKMHQKSIHYFTDS